MIGQHSKAGAAAKGVPNLASSAKTVASQPVVGYCIRSQTAQKEILVLRSYPCTQEGLLS